MVRQNKEPESDQITEEKLFWFLTTAFILRGAGLLAEGKEDKLNVLNANWLQIVKINLGVDESFIKEVYTLCTEYKDRNQSVAFILNGFGCPCVEQRMSEFSELTS